MHNFRLIVHIVYLFLHGCGLHYNVLLGLSVKREVKGLTTNKTGLLANIGATVSEVRFFMRLRT